MREKVLFNDSWRFHRGDPYIGKMPAPKGPLYRHAHAESAQWGPANRFYIDNNNWLPHGKLICTDAWEDVRLPHDYVVNGTPDVTVNEGLGFLESENAWYRKTFKLNEEDRNKRITIYFEGVTNCCTVWVNSCLVKRNFCGYVPFEVDITDYAVFGENNVIAIYIDTSSHEGWWYDGGGIFRNVWLQKTDLVSVDTYGVYVAPEKVSDTEWKVPVETVLRNDDNVNHRVVLKTELLSENGEVVASTHTTTTVALKDKKTVNQVMTVVSPKLWSCEEPNLYYCRSTVLRGETVLDQNKVHFGFRTIRFDSKKGFFLNEKPVKIKGVCAHEDYGLQGKAVFDRIKRYRVKLLKEMGCNGYRTSHYSQSDQTLDELDRQGFLVMNETRWFGTSDEYIDQLVTLVKKDRNRPSVIMWSLFNEELLAATDIGKRFVERNAAIVRRLDKTRPIASASDANPATVRCFDAQDIVGINYNLHNIDALHEKYPDKPIFSSENCATGTTRGWYMDSEPKKARISAYDHDTNTWFKSREFNWKFIMEREWLAGGYQWVAVEHRGEASWPRLCSASGALDLFLQKKDAFYQNKSHWSDEPMVHILPHWNLNGREGEMIPVWTYTNCEQVELFYNGKSMGKKDIERFGHGEWELQYAPGEVKAVGYIGGKQVASDVVATTGEPVALKLELQTESLTPSVYDAAVIHCYCVDENGNRVPDATPTVSFDCNELGVVLATGSDNTDHTPVACTKRRMYAGAISVLVGSTGKEGVLKVYASAPGLKTARLEIEVAPSELTR